MTLIDCRCWLWLPLLLLAGLVHAEKADRDKPMNIEADAMRYDDVQQTSVFSGKVVLTKGSIIIRGAVLNARQDAQGNQYGVVTAEPGGLAFFRQKRDGADEYIEGEGEVIEYDGRADTVRFVRRAQMRRYLGATLNDEMTGGLIVYNNSTEVFTVDGAATRANPVLGAGRVRAMLTPRIDAVPAKPGASAAAPATLRASSTLGGDKK